MAVDRALSSPLCPPAFDKHEKALQFNEEMTRNADMDQERILEDRKKEVDLKRFKLDGVTDRETFKAKIPEITNEHLQPEIQCIANGDRSAILSAHPISEFLTSSGTSDGQRATEFFIMILLSSFLSVKYPSQNVFEGHSFIMPILVVALIIYVTASWIEEKLKAAQSKLQTVVGKIRLLACFLSIVLLVLTLVSVVGWILLSLWSCLVLRLLWESRQEIYNFPRQAFDGLKRLSAYAFQSTAMETT